MTQNTNEVPSDDSDGISLREILLRMREWWNYLLSKWLVILIVGVCGGLLGITYATFKKPVYKAMLSFALEDAGGGGGMSTAAGLASQFGLDVGSGGGGGAFSGDNLLELIKSRSVVEKSLLSVQIIDGKPQTLVELYISFNDLRKNWENDPKLKGLTFPPNADRSKFTLQQDSVLGEFYDDIIEHNLSVDKTDKKLSIIQIKVVSKSQLFSKYFAEVLAETVSDFYIDTKTKKSVQNVSILQYQADSVRRALNAAIAGAASSSDFNPNPNPALLVLKVPSERRRVEITANAALLTELLKNLEVSKISLRKETPLIQVIDKPILPLEKEDLSKFKGFMSGALIGIFFITLYFFIKRIIKKLIDIL